jgi:hypothetical protein
MIADNYIFFDGHVYCCSLGVGKRSSNLAVIGELGRYPSFIEIIISMFSYLTCISNSKDILLSEALSVSKLLYDQNKKSWYSTILSISYELFLLLDHYIILKNNYLPCLIISGDQMYPTLHYHMLK